MLVALEIASLLEDIGCEPVGPVGHTQTALLAVTREPLDAALLDVDLGGESVEPVADFLRRRGIPFALITGYARDRLPARLRDDPLCRKALHVRRRKGRGSGALRGSVGTEPAPEAMSASNSAAHVDCDPGCLALRHRCRRARVRARDGDAQRGADDKPAASRTTGLRAPSSSAAKERGTAAVRP